MPEPKEIGKLVGEVVPGVYRVTMHDDRIDFESDSFVVVEKDRVGAGSISKGRRTAGTAPAIACPAA